MTPAAGAPTFARRLPAAALAACVIGLVLCPWGYVAIGALGDFARAAQAILLVSLLLASAYLLRRFVATPSAEADAYVPVDVLLREAVAWAVIVGVVVIVSRFRLLRGVERAGVAGACLLAGCALGLLVVLLRRTALERRMARLPGPVAVALSSGIVVLAAAVAIAGRAARSALP